MKWTTMNKLWTCFQLLYQFLDIPDQNSVTHDHSKAIRQFPKYSHYLKKKVGIVYNSTFLNSCCYIAIKRKTYIFENTLSLMLPVFWHISRVGTLKISFLGGHRITKALRTSPSPGEGVTHGFGRMACLQHFWFFQQFGLRRNVRKDGRGTLSFQKRALVWQDTQTRVRLCFAHARVHFLPKRKPPREKGIHISFCKKNKNLENIQHIRLFRLPPWKCGE